MTRKTGFLLTSLFVAAAACGQQRHVVISPLIGDTLDVVERLSYRLFPEVSGFQWAVFTMQENSSTVQVRMYIVERGEPRIRITNAGSAKFLQARIASAAGLNPSIASTWEITIVPPAPKPEPKDQSSENPVRGHQAEGRVLASRTSPVTGYRFRESKSVSDELPLAEIPASSILTQSYPDWGFGMGLSSYGVDLQSLYDAFRAAEDIYRRQGYTIARANPRIEIGTLLSVSLKIRLTQQFLLQFETSANTSESGEFRSVAANALYYVDLFGSSAARPYVSSGIGHFFLRGAVQHGELISPPENYQYLDGIDFSASGLFFPVEVGVELSPQSNICLTLGAAYLIAPVQETFVGGEQCELHMSGSIFRVQLAVFF